MGSNADYLFQNPVPDASVDLPAVTRFELIDCRFNAPSIGRVFLVWNETTRVVCSIQDQGRTLKVFLEDRED